MAISVDEAYTILRYLLRSRAGDDTIPDFDELFRVVSAFELVEFNAPDIADSDGFLFEYGLVNWLEEPMVSVGFMRQLASGNDVSEDVCLSRINFCYHFRPDDDLWSLADRHTWWFRGEGRTFSDWLSTVREDLVWRLVMQKVPVEFSCTKECVD